jgi:hypothetical protein
METDQVSMNRHRPALRRVVGIDFSGAAMSGQTAWAAQTEVIDAGNRLVLSQLSSLGKLAGDDSRPAVNAYLVQAIRDSSDTLWGMDFPFGLPIELGLGTWHQQLKYVANFSGNAKDLGRHLVQTAQTLGHTMHVRRVTDRETQTPFDCYHYRIIYQTFHGMRDVLLPAAKHRWTCVLPFHYRRFDTAKRWIVETCPSSTLKRLKLPHRLYKQSAGKPPTESQKSIRKTILKALTHPITGFIEIKPAFQKVMLHDPGGDALDSVLAAVGSFTDFRNADHASIRRHPRYSLEGRVYG